MHLYSVFYKNQTNTRMYEQTLKQVDDALTARELIKLRTLETAPQTAKETANLIASKVNADVVQVIGSKFILYRASKEKLITLVK